MQGEGTGSVTIPAGSSLSDARRRMFLQTLSSTGGDLPRTAKLLGVGEDEVRQELAALLDGTTAERQGAPTPPPVAAPKAPLPTAKKTPTKKR
jgi:hypothetical protein